MNAPAGTRVAQPRTRLNINLDANLKQQASLTLADLGLDFTTAITIYFKQIVSKRRIPFEISLPALHTIESVAGANWRQEVADLADEWE
jgi:DNA-damage-inducible protein J